MRASVLRGGLVVIAVMAVALALLPRDACAVAFGQAGLHPVPDEIDASGEHDVTAPLAEFIADVPAGSVVLFAPAGRYRVEGTVEIHAADRLTLDGNGATIFATSEGAPTRAHLRFVGGSDVSVQRLQISGPNALGGTDEAYDERLQYQHGIDLRGVTGVTVAAVGVSSVYGDCFYVGQATDGSRRWSSDVAIQDSACERNGRQGVAVTAGDGVLVERSSFTGIGLSAVDLEPNGTGDGATNVTVRSNTVSGVGQWFVALLGEPPVGPVSVIGNTLRGTSLAMLMDLHGRHRITDVVIDGNRSDTAERVNPTNAVIDARRIDTLRVTDNVQPLGPGQRLLRTPRSCGVDVRANRSG